MHSTKYFIMAFNKNINYSNWKYVFIILEIYICLIIKSIVPTTIIIHF